MSDKAKQMQLRQGAGTKLEASESQDNFVEDDYIDDDFEVEEESGSMQYSNSKVQNNLGSHGKTKKVGETLVDFNVSASASMLPPLAGGKTHTALDNFQSNPSQKDFKPLPEHFALNLAESEQSLNFDISDSRTLN